MKQKGFSLIELLIVVAIILIIAAIAIPNLLRSRIAANEASAVGSLRTMNTAMVTYASTYPATSFPSALTSLGPSGAASPTAALADLLDSVLGVAAPQKSGYNFVFTGGAASAGVPAGVVTYAIAANPITPNTTGIRAFLTSQSGVIRDCGAVATAPAGDGSGAAPATCVPTQ